MNSYSLLVVVAGVALSITIIGWRKVLVWALSGLLTLAILGVVQVVTILASGARRTP